MDESDPEPGPAPDAGGYPPSDEAYRVLSGPPVGGPDRGGDAPLPARTRDEAQLYMDLHPCGGCGRVKAPWKFGTVFVADVVARAYVGICPGCGRERRFVFEAVDPASVPPAGVVSFGGPQPSC